MRPKSSVTYFFFLAVFFFAAFFTAFLAVFLTAFFTAFFALFFAAMMYSFIRKTLFTIELQLTKNRQPACIDS
ncbi:MAG: hypothetical protein A2V58_04495 [Candidatus Muproteobacteria bacterium RBG_19FT_COMBO_61_10]|uniref:Uncharacterized protein n=1 Tax=Candidatus Muproteobacteria bacterium RBG_19FT_COMBO_61_10 TaxID=1817761 RepID=A0A1F6UPN7_9PROT|nr:MAG: hypothetical protein A2V58_04495 [Candidatus Muproteobacteria bacterium RBG_19FT_COMBO_61_10]